MSDDKFEAACGAIKEVLDPIKSAKKRAQMLTLAAQTAAEFGAVPKVVLGGGAHGKLNELMGLESEIDPNYLHRILTGEDVHKALKLRTDRAALLTEKIKTTDRELAAIRDLIDWLGKPLRLERATVSKFHKVVEAVRANDCIVPMWDSQLLSDDMLAVFGSSDGAKVFLVQHDWAGAFANAKGDDVGKANEWRTPSDTTIFEFVLSGKHVCTYVASFDGMPDILIPFFETRVGWGILYPFDLRSGIWKPFKTQATKDIGDWGKPFDLIFNQIRAMAIALDAEVVDANVVHAPYKLNQARQKAGKLPLYDYHEVSLTNRRRSAPLPLGMRDTIEYTKKRLHFRRGHWRHFENRKTWIRWMLVGNPDLGFVDKHYKV